MKLGTDKYLKFVRDCLQENIKILFDVVNTIPKKNEGLAVAFFMTLWAIMDSCQSIFILSKNKKMRDCFICARAIFDSALNIGYYSVKGNEILDKAFNHSLQKSYRDLKREIELNDFKLIIGIKDIESIPKTDRLRKSMEEFTSKKGLEVRAWTGDNIYTKIDLITDKFCKRIGIPFTMAFYYIYRHASEIIHGTIFGAMYNFGMTQFRHEWPESQKDINEYYNTVISMIILSVNLLIPSVISIINSHYKMNELVDKSKDVVSKQRHSLQNNSKPKY